MQYRVFVNLTAFLPPSPPLHLALTIPDLRDQVTVLPAIVGPRRTLSGEGKLMPPTLSPLTVHAIRPQSLLEDGLARSVGALAAGRQDAVLSATLATT